MVQKNKNEFQPFYAYIGTLFDFSIFKKKQNRTNLLIYSGIMLVIISLLDLIKHETMPIPIYNSSILAFVYTLITYPIVLFIFFSVFYLFLKAFEDKVKDFLNGFLVYLSIMLTFAIPLNIFYWVLDIISSRIIFLLFAFVLFGFLIYFIVSLIIHLRTYYNTSGFKVACSVILGLITFFILSQQLTLILGF